MKDDFKYNTQEEHRYGLVGEIIGILLGLLLCALISGCKSSACGVKDVDIEIWHDTTYITKLQRDSIYLRDSIYHEIIQKGDTVFVNTDRWHTAYKEKLRVDTCYIAKTDTVTKTITVMEKKTWWQHTKETLGNILECLFVFVALCIGLAVILWYEKKTKHGT